MAAPDPSLPLANAMLVGNCGKNGDFTTAAAEGGPEKLVGGVDVGLAELPPNLGVNFGVLGPGERIGTTCDRGISAKTSGSGRGLGVG